MDVVVAPLLHNNEPVKPEAVNTEFPQLLITVTDGALGVGSGAAEPVPCSLVQPLTVCVTEYTPAFVTVIDDEFAPLLHKREPLKSEAVNTELSQLLTIDTVGAAGIGFGVATPAPGELLHPFTD